MQNANFTKGFILSFLGLGSILLLLQLVLIFAGELSLNHIMKRQFEDSKILFSSGINQDPYEYKFALLNKVKPEVVVVGSSRAMQVRQEFFSKKFVNLGGTVSNISQVCKG